MSILRHDQSDRREPPSGSATRAGRVFDGTQLRFDGWRADYGIGFRLIWNLVTTVSFDFGISDEGQIFQMALGYAF